MNQPPYTDNVKRLVQLAQKEAERLGHDMVGTEHLLLAILRLGEGVAVMALVNLGLDLESVRQAVESAVPPSKDTVVGGQRPFTPRAHQILERAVDIARRMKSEYTGTNMCSWPF